MTPIIIIGTRPEAIKMAPVIWEFEAKGINPIVVHTGQHEDLLKPIFKELKISPAFHIELFRSGQTLNELFSKLLIGLDDVLQQIQETEVVLLVQGDTTSAAAAAVAAFHRNVPVAHIEAGLRTHDPTSPFPEEINRQIISRVAQYHFAPTQTSKHNLLLEGIREDRIFVTGNTVIDTLYHVRNELKKTNSSNSTRTILATMHRRENKTHMQSLIAALEELACHYRVVLQVHPNPFVQEAVQRFSKHIILIQPQSYYKWVELLMSSTLVITDSGGLQEECPALGIPLIITRKNTERPEVIDQGYGILAGTNKSEIVNLSVQIMEGNLILAKGSPFGDGLASKRIVNKLLQSP